MNPDSDMIQSAVEALGCGVYIAGADGTLLYVNPQLARLTGYQPEELEGRNLRELDPAAAEPALGDDTPDEPRERVLRRADGSLIRVLETSRALKGRDASVGSILPASAEVMSEHAVHYELERELARSLRHGVALSILLVGIDHGPRTNDAPELSILRALAATIAAALRPSDRVGQAGSDRFLVILPQTEHAGARTVAERVRHAVRERSGIAAGAPTVSIGIAALGAQRSSNPRAISHTSDSLLELAGEELAVLRESGSDRIGG